jgi:hypothetical protein
VSDATEPRPIIARVDDDGRVLADAFPEEILVDGKMLAHMDPERVEACEKPEGNELCFIFDNGRALYRVVDADQLTMRWRCKLLGAVGPH